MLWSAGGEGRAPATGRQRASYRATRRRPGGADRCRRVTVVTAGGGHDGDERCELDGVGGSAYDAEHRTLGCRPRCGVGRAAVVAHSGMFPCFLGGRVARLVRRARSARVIWARVSLGRMTASM